MTCRLPLEPLNQGSSQLLRSGRAHFSWAIRCHRECYLILWWSLLTKVHSGANITDLSYECDGMWHGLMVWCCSIKQMNRKMMNLSLHDLWIPVTVVVRFISISHSELCQGVYQLCGLLESFQFGNIISNTIAHLGKNSHNSCKILVNMVCERKRTALN